MKRLLAVSLLFCAWGLSAADKLAVREPGKIPSRIILTWSGEPARTQTVTWRTDALAVSAQAQIAPLNGSPEVEKTATVVKGTGITVPLPAGKTAAQYVVRFEGLKPGTKYTYRVGDGATWSEWSVFQTAADRPGPFRFIYVGDAQNDIHSLWSRSIRAAYAAAPDARFIMDAGDLVTDGSDDSLWGDWCEALGFISAMVPSVPVPGNHDLHHPSGAVDPEHPQKAADLWFRHFALPQNGPEGLLGQSYYIDYQGVRLIALDVNSIAYQVGTDDPGHRYGKARNLMAQVAQQEVAWLEKVLADNPNRWTVVCQHQPVYPIAKNRTYMATMQAMLVPLYDKYGVDLVLQGHDHSYGRTHLLRAGKVVPAGGRGTTYVVSVSGPKMYDLTVTDPGLMAKTLSGTQLYQIVSVERDRLAYRAYSIDCAVVDSFEIRKTAAAN